MAETQTKRSFLKVYTPKNILLECIDRLKRLKPHLQFRGRREVEYNDVYDNHHASRVGSFYDSYHDKFLRVYGPVIQAFRTTNINHLLDYELAAMGLTSGQRVLDAGCGVGMPALYFARNAGIQVDAITISQKQYQAALANIRAEGMEQQVQVVRGDFHLLPEYFPPLSYDVVYFLESFGHSRAKQHLLNVCWKMLKPGGLLYIKDLFQRIPLLASHKKKLPRRCER